MRPQAALCVLATLAAAACGSGSDGSLPSGDGAFAPAGPPDAGPGEVAPPAVAGAAADGGGNEAGSDAGVAPDGSPLVPDGDWSIIDDALVGRLTTSGELPPKDAAAALKYQLFGPTAGVGCDPFSGDLYMGLAGAGVWRSTDQGKTFTAFVSTAISGEYAGFLNADLDTPGRLAFFGADDDSVLTVDDGKTWSKLTRPLFSRGWNGGAADWSSPTPGTVLVLEHGAGADRYVSANGGQSFQRMRAGDDVRSSVGVFDATTLVTSDAQGIWRSTDAGATWTQVLDRPAYSSAMVLRRGIGYLATEHGLIQSTDKGQTWTQLGDATYAFERGPWFESDQVVVAADARGFHISTDRAAHWALLGGWPAGFYDPSKPAMELGDHSNAAWDTVHHVAYVCDFKNIHKTGATVGTFSGHTFRQRFRGR